MMNDAEECKVFKLKVDSFHELEGPLGGVSVEYGVCLQTNLKEFAAPMEEIDIHVTLNKTFWECDDFLCRLSKKCGLPLPPKPASEDPTPRLNFLNAAMQCVANHKQLHTHPLVVQFLDTNKATPVPTEQQLRKTTSTTRATIPPCVIRQVDLFDPSDDEDSDLFTSVHSVRSPNVYLFDKLELRGPLIQDGASTILPTDVSVNRPPTQQQEIFCRVGVSPTADTSVLQTVETSVLPTAKPSLPNKPKIPPKPSHAPQPASRQKKEPIPVPRVAPLPSPRRNVSQVPLSQSDISNYIQQEEERLQDDDLDLFS